MTLWIIDLFFIFSRKNSAELTGDPSWDHRVLSFMRLYEFLLFFTQYCRIAWKLKRNFTWKFQFSHSRVICDPGCFSSSSFLQFEEATSKRLSRPYTRMSSLLNERKWFSRLSIQLLRLEVFIKLCKCPLMQLIESWYADSL